MSIYGSVEEDVKAYLDGFIEDYDLDGIMSDLRERGIEDIDAMDGDDFVSIIQAHDVSGK